MLKQLLVVFLLVNAFSGGLASHKQHCKRVASKFGMKKCPPALDSCVCHGFRVVSFDPLFGSRRVRSLINICSINHLKINRL